MNKPTLILGASDNPERYSYKATLALAKNGHTPLPVGLKKGKIEDIDILTDFPIIKNIDTITLYIGSKNQPQMYDYILAIKPKRIIFNPGTENPELEKLATDNGIEITIACTLVLLSIANF